MCYRPDGTADFVGLQRIDATIEGRTGTVVVRSVGVFDGEKAVGGWSVVDGSATGDLAGATGNGYFEAPMGGTPTFELRARAGSQLTLSDFGGLAPTGVSRCDPTGRAWRRGR